MRSAVLILALSLPAVALAQHNGGWSSVQSLPTGAKVHIKSGKHHLTCKVQSVTAESIACASGETVPRAEILSIKVSRRALSTLLGAGIGAGAGAGIGAGLSSTSKPGFATNGQVAGGFAVFGAVVGAPIGFFTDFAKSTIYRGP